MLDIVTVVIDVFVDNRPLLFLPLLWLTDVMMIVTVIV